MGATFKNITPSHDRVFFDLVLLNSAVYRINPYVYIFHKHSSHMSKLIMLPSSISIPTLHSLWLPVSLRLPLRAEHGGWPLGL